MKQISEQPPSSSRWLRCCQLEVGCRAWALSLIGLSDHAICYVNSPSTHGLRARFKDSLPGACPSKVRPPEGGFADSAPSIPPRSCPGFVMRRKHRSWTWSRTRDDIPTPFASPEGEGFLPPPEGTLRQPPATRASQPGLSDGQLHPCEQDSDRGERSVPGYSSSPSLAAPGSPSGEGP